MNSNQLPEWQAQHRERQRARMQPQARLAYIPQPKPRVPGFTPNVSRVGCPAPPTGWNRWSGDWSAN